LPVLTIYASIHLRIMNIKKVGIFLVISSFLLISNGASAAEDNSRYFVKTNSTFWKKSFNARHVFSGGFTADLTDFQLKLTKVFNIEIEPVRRLSILEPKGKSALRPVPTESVPWGVKAIYDDKNLLKSSGGAEATVAVLDTGIVKHPDLKNRIKDCKDFSSPARALVEGKCDDKNGHGTHVAGIIASDGGDDGKGIFGVAPETSLYAYKVCSNTGTCWADDVAAAIRTAADSGANIINLSLGSDAQSLLISDAVAYAVEKGVLVVAAAGNDGPYQGSIDFPAQDANVIAVGAIDSLFIVPDWSSRGANETTVSYVVEEKDIEFAAPGVNVESTWKDGGYVTLSGTSMSAPHVSGLAAKLWQKDSLTPSLSTRELLQKFASDILPLGDDDMSGFGLPQL